MSFQGKKNIYLCRNCGRGHVTLDVDKGTTPMFTKCLHCEGMCASMMYGAPQELLANIPPAIEWYHPTAEETIKLSPALRDHVRLFGLISRVVERPTDGKKSWR